MALIDTQEKLGVGKQRHASVRRAINKILAESTGKVPFKDLIRVSVLVSEALYRDTTH